MTNNYQEALESFWRSVKMPGQAMPGDEVSREKIIEQWRKIMKLAARNPAAFQRGIENYSTIYNVWQKGSLQMFNDWNACLKRVADVSLSAREKGGDPLQLLKACVLSVEEFFESCRDSRYAFTSEVMKVYFENLKFYLHEETDQSSQDTQKKLKK